MSKRLPIVFAPGLMCDERLFNPQVDCFRGARDVLVADFSNDDSIDAMARRLLANAPHRFFLAGLSMGGIVAFEVLRRAPDRIVGLALMNTTPFPDSPARKAVRRDQIRRVNNGELRTVVMEELKPNYLGQKKKNDQSTLDAIFEMADALGSGVFEQQSRALMARPDSTESLSRITCPTVIICGDEDEICPPELHEIMHRGIAGSSLVVLPGCGHLSTIEAPFAVNENLETYVLEAEGAMAQVNL